MVLAACCFSALGALADMPPALKPYADKFELDRSVLDTAKEAQIKPARERYLAALNTAQTAATTAARTADIAAINAEIESVNLNSVVPDFPPDLPRTLAQERRNYLAVVGNILRAMPQRQRDLAARYLQTLAALDTQAMKTKDSALGEAVANEKQRVLALMEAAGGGQKNRNIIPNNDFSDGEPGKFPPGWKKEADDVSYSDAMIVTEGRDKFLRFRRLQVQKRAGVVPEKDLPIPARAKSVEFSFRMRVKGLVVGTEWGIHPGVHCTVRDARGEEVAGEWGVTKTDCGWKRFSGRVEILATGKMLRVSVGPHGAAGIIDFDDINVEFH
jgi:hypothetical protein